MEQKEYCKTKCKFYEPRGNSTCKYLKEAFRDLRHFGFIIVKKGELYCDLHA